MKRQAFQRAIHYCAVNDVDYFIVWSTSRFARNKLDAASYKLLLRESGTRLVYASMNIDSDTDEGWFTDSIMEIMDEQVSRQISRDTRRAMLKNAEEGWFNGGRAPFGYQIMTQNKRRKLVPNDAEKTVQSGRGLVQNQEVGPVGQCGRHFQLRLHPTGVFFDPLVRGQLQGLQHPEKTGLVPSPTH